MAAVPWIVGAACLAVGVAAGMGVSSLQHEAAGDSSTEPTTEPVAPAATAIGFPGWDDVTVVQRGNTCVATGIEVLLRAARIPGIDFTHFQEEFDLGAANSFTTVGTKVHERYPQARIGVRHFGSGAEKLAFVEENWAKGRPTLVAIATGAEGGWHITPVVGCDERDLTLLAWKWSDGTRDVWVMPKKEFVRRHDEWPGGDDVAFLETDAD